MEFNPFAIRGMIKSESNFWDRTYEIETIYSWLLDSEEQPQSVAIVGQRRIGKSSLLYQIYQKWGADESYRDSLARTICVMISMQGLVDSSSDDFYLSIFENLELQNALPSDIAKSVVQDHADSPERKFRKLLGRLDRDKWIFVLLIDEFESAALNPNFDKNFFNKLRAAAQQWRLAFIIATQTNLDELWSKDLISSPLFSPFFNFFYTHDLPSFSQSDCVQYLKDTSTRAGLPFSDTQIDLVQRVGGTHPFFVNIAAYSVFQELTHYNDKQIDDDALYSQIIRDRATVGNFDYYWQKLSFDQQRVLRNVATKSLQFPYPDTTRVDLEKLERMSLIVRSDSTNYVPFSQAFGEYVCSLPEPLVENEVSLTSESLDILDLIAKDEGSELEFKSSLRWDYRQSVKADYIESEVIETVAAFLNTDGGTLLIGVDDSGNVLGLTRDYDTFSQGKGRDRFQSHLMNLVAAKLAVEICQYINLKVASCNGLDVCQISIKPSPKPVFVGKEKEVFIRRGNATVPLDTEQFFNYSRLHWA